MTKHVIKRTPTNVIWDETEVYGGELDDVAELLNEEVTLAFGRNRMDMKWQTGPIQLGSIVRQLCDHKVSKNKDGKCLTQGALVSKRRQMNNVSSLDLLILDMDTGQPIEEVRERLLQEGLMAVIYTTHSYGATSSLVMENKLMSTMEVTRDEIKAGGASIDTLVQDYFSTYMKYHKSITDGMKYVETKQVEGGIKVFVKHPPMQKYRIVMVLDEPYSFTDLKNGKDQRSAILKWKSKYAGVAELLNASFDTSCTDPSRLFYLPTHKKGGEYHTEIIIGDTLILEDIKAGNPKGHTITNAYMDAAEDTSDGRTRSSIDWLNSWASKNMKLFQAADFMLEYGGEELNIHQNGSAMTGMCPCDDRHSNPGDPNDSGFYCFNPDPDGDENKQYGYMGCSHNGCTEFGTTSFIEGLMEIGILSDSKEEVLKELNDFVEDKSIPFDVDDEDAVEPAKEAAKKQGDKPKTSTKSNTSKKKEPAKKAAENEQEGINDINDYPVKVQRIMKKIMKAKHMDTRSSDRIIEDLVDDDIDQGVAKVLLDQLSKATGFGKIDLKKQYSALIKQDAKEMKREDKKQSGDNRRSIDIRGSFEEVVKETLKGLGTISKKDPRLFIMDGVGLSRIVHSVENGNVSRDVVGRDALFMELTKALDYYEDGPGGVQINRAASKDIVAYMSGIPIENIPVPLLSSIVNHPIFSVDGKLHTKNGYDKDTTCYLKTSFTPLPVPDVPSEEDLDAAYNLIFDDVFVDFPLIDRQPDEDYDDPGMASKANLLAMLLQPFVRTIIGEAPTPMFILDKSLPSAGATKIADVLSIITDGVKSEKHELPFRDEELEKKLLSKVKSSPDGMMFYDNVASGQKIDSAVLASALTSDTYTGRVLGQSQQITTKIKHVWIASGNNLSFSNEIARRCVPITILPKEADPSTRSGFKHENLEDWVTEHRAEIVQALCVIVQNWVAKGMPNWEVPESGKSTVLGSYTPWSLVLGGIIQSFGMEGFLENVKAMREDSSHDMGGYAGLLEQCIDVAGGLGSTFTTPQVHNALWDDGGREYEGLDGIPINTSGGAGTAKNGLSKQIASIKDRPVIINYKEKEERVKLIKAGLTGGTLRWSIIRA